jgi:hypothetical protein
MVLLLLVREVR